MSSIESRQKEFRLKLHSGIDHLTDYFDASLEGINVRTIRIIIIIAVGKIYGIVIESFSDTVDEARSCSIDIRIVALIVLQRLLDLKVIIAINRSVKARYKPGSRWQRDQPDR